MTPPSNVTRKPSCFFKIILENTIREGKLRIPSKFLKYYGNCLSSPIILKDPTGTSWKVELLKNMNEVWLEKGWPEFSENHTLKYGRLVLFQYQRDSLFYVFIFDESTIEIEYSSSELHSRMQNFNGESPQPNKQEANDQDDISCGNQSKGKRKQFKDEKGITRQARRPKCSKTCGAHEAADSDFISSYPYFKVVLRQHHNVVWNL
ncbi:B3 domain-containing protein At4g01580-like [Hevea brasiliensis]|uniref:B3 domain-containing protein At4g01580-like n=1 Tax=Hevea brasiliensis TaxID=3981 RepID=UPI0025D4E3EE|nr:B3 domain-containing protein At4g01580-like [Hevea brasiliensis]